MLLLWEHQDASLPANLKQPAVSSLLYNTIFCSGFLGSLYISSQSGLWHSHDSVLWKY